MASSADDILTVDELKEELRIPASSTAQDDLLQRHIDSAISFISHGQPAPLLDASTTIRVEPATGDSPLTFRAVGVREVTEIRYWSTSVALRDAPDETIPLADLGRVEQDRRDVSVYGPVDGWPETLTGSIFEVEIVRGIRDKDIPGYRAAVASFVRHAYDGFREIRPTESFAKMSRALSR